MAVAAAVTMLGGGVAAAGPPGAVPATGRPPAAQAPTGPPGAVSSAVPQVPADGWERLAGPTRYETAVEVSRHRFPDPEAVCCDLTVVIAEGEYPADAVVAGSLASANTMKGLLLVRRTELPDVVAEELARLKPAELVVVGGERAVSPEVVEAARLATGVPDVRVVRLAGENRFETSAAVAASGYFYDVETDYPQDLVIASGADFPDALAASGLNGLDGAPSPVLLVTRDYVPGAVLAFLESNPSTATITVVGGPAAVSEAAVREIRVRDRHVAIFRIGGRDRYETAALVAHRRLRPGPAEKRAYVATGEDFPDALTAGPAAVQAAGVLLLTRQDCHPPVVADLVDEYAFTRFVAVGGADVVYGGTQTC